MSDTSSIVRSGLETLFGGETHFSEGASPPTGWIGWTLKAWELVKYSGKLYIRSESWPLTNPTFCAFADCLQCNETEGQKIPPTKNLKNRIIVILGN